MKDYLTIVLSFLIGINAHHEVHLVPAHKICPDVTGDHDILLPDPKDCSVYYRCENGTAVPQSCPPGLAWCQILQNCTLPILANCTLSHTIVTYSPEELVTYNPNSTTTENPVTGPVTSSETCPKDGASVPNPDDCRKYYKCKKGKPHPERCPGKKRYSTWLGICIAPEIANCINVGTQENKTCPVNGARKAYPSDCSKYYECVGNTVEIKQCPSGKEYNKWFKDCYSPELAYCHRYTTVSPTTSPSTIQTPGPENTCPEYGYKLPNPLNCTTYYVCENNSPTLQNCPAGFEYSCWDQECLPPSDGQCLPTQGQSCKNSEEKLPNPQDCHSYFECKNGTTVKKNCKNGLQYNSWFKKCVRPNVAHCKVEEPTTPTTSPKPPHTPSPSETTDICPIAGAKLPDPLDCHSYYICKNETPVRKTCPQDMEYSCWDQECLPAESADCIDNINQTGYCCKTDNTTMPNIYDCSSYYKCEKGTIVLLNCDNGLEFNAWYGKCVNSPLSHCKRSTTENPHTTPPNVLCSQPGLKYPSSKYCNAYMICDSNRQLKTVQCNPSTFHYNCETKKCENMTHCCSRSTETMPPPTEASTGITTGSSSETSVPTGESTVNSSEATIPTGESSETTVSTGGSTETTASSGLSSETTTPTGGSTETTASPIGSSSETSVPTGGSTVNSSEPTSSTGESSETTVSTGGSTETTTSSGLSSETTTPTGGSTETTASPIGSSSETSVPTGGSTVNSSEPTSSTGESSETTVSTGGSTETTSSGLSSETTTPTGGSTETTASPIGSSSETSVPTSESTVNSSEPTSLTGESSETTVSTGGSTETTTSSGLSSETTTPTGGSTETTASPIGSSSETSVPTGGSTVNSSEPTSSTAESSETTVSTGGSTETTTSSGLSSETTTPTGGSTETTASPIGSSSETSVPTSGSTVNSSEPTSSTAESSETTVSTGGSTETTTSSGLSSETTTPTGGSTETTASPIGSSSETSVPTSGSTVNSSEPTSSTGESSETTVSTGGSTETTTSSGLSSETTTPTGVSTETTASTGGPIVSSSETSIPTGGSTVNSSEPTSSTGESSETTVSTGGSTETTTSSGLSSETITPTGGSTETTASTGGPIGSSSETSVPTSESTVNSSEPTSLTGESSETTVSTGGSTETTTSSGLSSETTTPTGGSTETTASTGGPIGSSSETSVPTGGPTPTTTGPPSVLCPKPGIQYPSYKYCNAYMICDINRQLETVECNPSTFHYNCETKTCENITHCCSPTTQTMPPPTGTTLTITTIPTSSPSPSTTDDVCPSDGTKLPNPLDCTSYFICRNNTPVTQHCPSGQEYNCWNQQCEDPKDAVCIDSSHPGQSCSHNDEKLPNIGDCGSYYQCVKGKTELKQCSSGKLYNKWFKKCVIASLSHCETYPTSPGSGTPTTISPSPTQNVCPFEGARLPNPMNCSTYFVCLNNEPSLESCPPGQEYSCWDQECESSATAQCITNSHPGDSCSINNLLLPNTEDCRSYYKCQNGSTVTMKCPPDTQFNSWFQKCVKSKYAHCQPSTTSPSTPTTITTPHTTSSPSATEDVCPIEGAKLPNPLDCSSYFICINETAQKQQCPSGQEYSCWDQKCEKPENSTCIKEGSQEGQQCPKDGEQQQNVEDCGSYYECDHGKIKLKYCSKGKFYNKWYKKCMSRQFAHCKTSPTIKPPYSTLPPPTTVSPSTTDNICPFEGALLPNPLNCSTYFTCINNEPTLESCPSGQGYSCWNQQCESGALDACNPNSGAGQSCSVDGLILPISGDCKGYLECINGTVNNKTCPPGKKFNSWFGKCVESKYSHCLPPTTVTLPPTPTKNPNTCPLDGAILPNPLDCNSYFTCEKEKIVMKRCPAGQIYSCWDQKCKIPQDGTCINQGHQQGQHCSIEGTLLPNIDSCSSYYQCIKGKIEIKFCGSGQIYNKWLKICVSTTAVICVTYPTRPAITTPPGPTGPTAPSEGNNVCPMEGALIPNPLDCTTYYKCIEGILVLQNCLDGNKYSCWDQQCEPDYEATCVSEGGQNGKNCSVEGLRITDVTNCNNYYECYNGTTILRHCPHGEEFNANFQKCYKPKFAHCNKYSTITPKPVTKTTPPTITISPNTDLCPFEGALLPNPLDCSTYYKCVNDTPVEQSCAKGYEYSCWIQECKPAGEAQCITDVVQVNTSCKRNGQQIQNPKDCHSYYECVNGKVQEKRCPLLWYYNKWFHICVPFAILAHCKPTTITVPPITLPTTTPGPQIINDVCPKDGILLPDPLDCSGYYICVNSKPTSRKCPSGQEYSCWDQKCKAASDAQCINAGVQLGQNCSRDGVRLQNLESCSSYYECVHGKVQKNYCFIGFQYNRWYQKCMLFPYAHCKTYLIKTTTTTTPTTVTPTTPTTVTPTTRKHNILCPVNGLVYPSTIPGDCGGYLVCENYQPVRHQCPFDRPTYNCETKNCEFQWGIPHCCAPPIQP